jgi:hypothetical protein
LIGDTSPPRLTFLSDVDVGMALSRDLLQRMRTIQHQVLLLECTVLKRYPASLSPRRDVTQL